MKPIFILSLFIASSCAAPGMLKATTEIVFKDSRFIAAHTYFKYNYSTAGPNTRLTQAKWIKNHSKYNSWLAPDKKSLETAFYKYRLMYGAKAEYSANELDFLEMFDVAKGIKDNISILPGQIQSANRYVLATFRDAYPLYLKYRHPADDQKVQGCLAKWKAMSNEQKDGLLKEIFNLTPDRDQARLQNPAGPYVFFVMPNSAYPTWQTYSGGHVIYMNKNRWFLTCTDF